MSDKKIDITENNGLKNQPKKKFSIKIFVGVIVAAILVFVATGPIGEQFTMMASEAMNLENTMYLAENDDLSIGERIKLIKCIYSYNNCDNQDLIDKYSNPAWDKILQDNAGLEDNYNMQFEFNTKCADFEYSIDVNKNVSKTTLVATPFGYGEEGLTAADEKTYEWYSILEDDMIVSYMQDENGKWMKTISEPISDGHVFLGVEELLKKISEQKHSYFPSKINDEESDFVDNVYLYNDDVIRGQNMWYCDCGGEHNKTILTRFNQKDGTYRLNYVRRTVDLGNLLSNDQKLTENEFFDYLCDTEDDGFMEFYFGQYGEINIELPDAIEVSEEVDGFQFILEDVLMNSEAYQHDMTEG